MEVKVLRGNRYLVRVPELFPCPRFSCIHDSMACATVLWCPEGSQDNNKYGGACIPRCIDCVEYINGKCQEWEHLPGKELHDVFTNKDHKEKELNPSRR